MKLLLKTWENPLPFQFLKNGLATEFAKTHFLVASNVIPQISS
jgi:hypothetical protein